MSKGLSVESLQKGELVKRFLARRILRRVASGQYDESTIEQIDIAKQILADEAKVNYFANDLFLEAEVKSGLSTSVHLGMTESQFLDAILKVFEWIKENPEFILLIIKLFGVV